MANRYLISAAGTNLTSYWSATSGGAGGASVPTAADNVFLDAGMSWRLLRPARTTGRGGAASTAISPRCHHEADALNYIEESADPLRR